MLPGTQHNQPAQPASHSTQQDALLGEARVLDRQSREIGTFVLVDVAFVHATVLVNLGVRTVADRPHAIRMRASSGASSGASSSCRTAV